MKSFSIIAALMLFATLFAGAVHGQAVAPDASKAKAERVVIVPQNNYQAYVAGTEAAHNARADQCDSKTGALKAMAAKCTSDMCLAYFADKVERACGDSGSSGNVAAAIAPPPVEKSAWQEVKETFKDGLATAFPILDRVFARQERRDATQSQERQTVALYGTFRDIHGQTATSLTTLGTAGYGALERTATSGFGALERGMTAGFGALSQPRDPANVYNIQVTGDDNSLFGSTNNRRTNCTGTGGAGGVTTSGIAGVEASNSGATGSAPGGAAPCTFTK